MDMTTFLDPPRMALPGLFSFSMRRASRLQPIRRLPIFKPALIRIVQGSKRIYQGDLSYDSQPGQIVVFPPHIEINLANIPGPSGYLAEVLIIAPEAIALFRQKHAGAINNLLAQPAASTLNCTPGPTLQSAWQHLLELWQPGTEPAREIAQHRLDEVLLSMALQGSGQVLFLDQEHAWKERVRILLTQNPDRKWITADLAQQLHCSEATLRRHLARENSSLRELLEAVRMDAGLSLVLNTERQIDTIALACGYESASRFSIRFRLRFGQSPSEMRATR